MGIFDFGDNEKTRIVLDKIYSAYSCGEDIEPDYIEVINNAGYAYELESENFFLDGICDVLNKKFNNKVETSGEVLKILKNRYAEKNIELSDSLRRTLSNWLSGKRISTNRDDRKKLYDLCTALDMNVYETAEFFLKVVHTMPFNYKDRTDAVYFYCIHNGRDRETLLHLLKECENSEDLNLENINTQQIGLKIMEIHDDDEFLEFIKKYSFSEDMQLTTAKRHIVRLIEENFEIVRKTSRKSVKTVSGLLAEIYGYNIQAQYREGKGGISKGRFPKNFSESFPSDTEFSKIKNNKKVSYETVRKALVIMEFYNFYCEYINATKYPDTEEVHENFCDFISELNLLLTDSGFVQLYVRNSFDFLILYCACTQNPVDTFRELISEKYLELFDNL